MESIKLVKKDNHYNAKEGSNIEMYILGNFLTDDVGSYWPPTYREWVYEDEFHGSGGNTSWLRKEGDNILLGSILTDDDDDDGGPYLTIFKTEFVRILDEWEQFCKTKPKEVIITRENGKITLEGKDC